MNISERDKNIIWHPFTQEKTAGLPIAIEKAQGSYVYDENNKSYLDLISSWWVNLHGHSHPEIARAIYDQALKLEHVIFAGFTHEPAVKLCEIIKSLLPEQLSRFFFSDNGSTSVEIALKMSYQYWRNIGQEGRKIFLSFEGGYHGDTFGSMSVGVKSGFHSHFKDLFFEVLTVPFPSTWDGDENVYSKEESSLKILSQHLEDNEDKISAIILEPIIQGASGMRICRIEFMRKVVELAKKYNILVIYDEVMTGFGRTGKIFALEHIDITPDILCLSKGITGGFLPLALTVTTDQIYSSFLGDNWNQAFAHGHSYTANPIACSAAIASCNLLMRPETQKAIETINNVHHKGISYLRNKGLNIANTRILGTIAAFEVGGSYHYDINKELKSRFLNIGLLLRPLGKTIYLLPPYSVTRAELEEAYYKIYKVIKNLVIG